LKLSVHSLSLMLLQQLLHTLFPPRRSLVAHRNIPSALPKPSNDPNADDLQNLLLIGV
jgi:hypothetical protein